MTTFCEGRAEQRQHRDTMGVPSYMQPTRASKLKENMYGTEFKFTPKRSTMNVSPLPSEHGLDYIPPRPTSPGCPRYMKPTSTSQRKVTDGVKRGPGRSHQKKNYLLEASARLDLYGMAGTVSHHAQAYVSHSRRQRVESNTCEPNPTRYLSWKEEIAKEQKRKRSYSHVTSNPTPMGSFEAPPCFSRKSTGMDEHLKSLIQTAPAADFYRDESSDSQTMGPSTPSLGTPRRPKCLPRYMMPTTSSAARFKQ